VLDTTHLSVTDIVTEIVERYRARVASGVDDGSTGAGEQ
jgi:hypothetical protein